MNDGEALRRAVLADPDDDTPRLVYADWLDENGQADRAAFVRAQVEAARAEQDGPQARNATARADRILERFRPAWTRHLRGVHRSQFRRGFVAHLEVEPTAFVPAAPYLFGSEPVQELRLFRFAAPAGGVSLRPVFDLPQLNRVRRLEFTTHIGLSPEEYAALSGCENLGGLRELSLRGNPVPPPWLAAVLTGGAFPGLRALDLADIPNLGRVLAEALPRADHRDVRALDVTGVVFASDQLKQLLGSRCLQRAEELRLGCWTRPGDVGPLFHLNAGWVIPCERLVVLDLAGQRLGSEGVREVVQNPRTAALRWLGLSNNDLGPSAVGCLVEARHLNLNYLDVRGNRFGLAELAALQRRFPAAVIAGEPG